MERAFYKFDGQLELVGKGSSRKRFIFPIVGVIILIAIFAVVLGLIPVYIGSSSSSSSSTTTSTTTVTRTQTIDNLVQFTTGARAIYIINNLNVTSLTLKILEFINNKTSNTPSVNASWTLSGNTYSLKTTIVYVKTGTNVNSTVNATSGLDLVNLIEANKNEIAKLAPNSLSITLITDNAAITDVEEAQEFQTGSLYKKRTKTCRITKTSAYCEENFTSYSNGASTIDSFIPFNSTSAASTAAISGSSVSGSAASITSSNSAASITNTLTSGISGSITSAITGSIATNTRTNEFSNIPTSFMPSFTSGLISTLTTTTGATVQLTKTAELKDLVVLDTSKSARNYLIANNIDVTDLTEMTLRIVRIQAYTAKNISAEWIAEGAVYKLKVIVLWQQATYSLDEVINSPPAAAILQQIELQKNEIISQAPASVVITIDISKVVVLETESAVEGDPVSGGKEIIKTCSGNGPSQSCEKKTIIIEPGGSTLQQETETFTVIVTTPVITTPFRTETTVSFTKTSEIPTTTGDIQTSKSTIDTTGSTSNPIDVSKTTTSATTKLNLETTTTLNTKLTTIQTTDAKTSTTTSIENLNTKTTSITELTSSPNGLTSTKTTSEVITESTSSLITDILTTKAQTTETSSSTLTTETKTTTTEVSTMSTIETSFTPESSTSTTVLISSPTQSEITSSTTTQSTTTTDTMDDVTDEFFN